MSKNPAMSSSTNLFGTHGSCTCGFADVPAELPCEVHPSKERPVIGRNGGWGGVPTIVLTPEEGAAWPHDIDLQREVVAQAVAINGGNAIVCYGGGQGLHIDTISRGVVQDHPAEWQPCKRGNDVCPKGCCS